MTFDFCSSETGLVIYFFSDPCVNGFWRFESLLYGQGVVLWRRGCRISRLVPAVCMMVVNLRSQVVLVDPPIAAGVSTSNLVWQLRPTRDCGILSPRPSLKRGVVVPKEHLRVAGTSDAVSEAVAVSLMMIHGRIETPIAYLPLKLTGVANEQINALEATFVPQAFGYDTLVSCLEWLAGYTCLRKLQV
jgi:hypothetical protein